MPQSQPAGIDRQASTRSPRGQDSILDGEVVVWLADPAAVQAAGALAGCGALLPPDELARCERFSVPEQRRERLVGRVLARTALSRHADVSPRDWRFSTSPTGRPGIASPSGAGLSFNLSHARGLVACAIARAPEVGVDVAAIDRFPAPIDLADRLLAPLEVAEILRQPRNGQGDRFFDFWTLREAYLKARGLGLTVPRQGFSFRLSLPIGVETVGSFDVGAAWWQFFLLRPTPGHRAAVAVRGGAEACARLVTRWWRG